LISLEEEGKDKLNKAKVFVGGGGGSSEWWESLEASCLLSPVSFIKTQKHVEERERQAIPRHQLLRGDGVGHAGDRLVEVRYGTGGEEETRRRGDKEVADDRSGGMEQALMKDKQVSDLLLQNDFFKL